MPVRRCLLFSALLSLTVGIVASCSLGSERHQGDPPPTSSPSAPTTSTTLAAEPELTASGSTPRVSLRLGLVVGTSQLVDVTTDLGVVEQEPNGPQTVDPPPVVQTIRFRVDTVSNDGSATVSFEVTDAKVGRGNALTVEEQLTYTAALAGLKGIGGRGRLSAQGRFQDVRLFVPTGTGPSVRAQVNTLRTQITQLAGSLPSEPVGVGASWTSDATTSLGGATVTQSVNTTVIAVDGDQVSYTSTTRSTAARQPLVVAGLPAGTTAMLASSEVIGTGSGTLDLTTVASISSTSSVGTQVIELRNGTDPPQSTTQRITVATRSEPRS